MAVPRDALLSSPTSTRPKGPGTRPPTRKSSSGSVGDAPKEVASPSAPATQTAAAPAAPVTRGSISLPKLEKIDHSQYATERERVAAGVNVDETNARMADMSFNFSFG